MKRACFLLALLVVATPGIAQQTAERPSGKPSEKASIAGTVTRKGSDEPVKKAQVLLQKVEGPPYGAVTDAGGRFTIEGVEPGQYHLSAMRSGYVQQEYGQRSLGRPGTTLALAAGQRLRDIDFHLTPAGVITGRVVDEDNEPVANVRVQALQFRYWDRQRRLVPAGNAGTNDLGEYRLFGLLPGRYYISATYTAGVTGLTVIGTSTRVYMSQAAPERESYVPTYYPGTNDAAHAAAVGVTAGGEQRGIDITLLQTRTVNVRGRVTNGATGRPRNASVFLWPRETNLDALVGQNRTSVQGGQGTFQVSGVAPGSYYVISDFFGEGKRYFARVPLEVGNRDVDGVTVELTPGIDVTGHVRVQGEGQIALNELSVGLNPGEEGRMTGGGGGRLKPDGSFLVQDLAPQQYRINVFGMPEDYYLQSARMGDDDVLETGLDLSHTAAAPGSLEITISSGAGKIDGTVMDDKQKPFSGVQVTLAPKTDQPGRSDLYKATTTDQYGRFTLKGIPPGDYRLLAFEDIEPGAYQDPEYLKPYEDKAETVRMGRGDAKTVQLEGIPTEESAAAAAR